MLPRIGLAMLLLCASVQSWAVDTLAAPQPRQFSVFDGLPSNRVNAIAEDAQGYLWIGTRDGLARYDGVGFRIWRVGDGLKDNFIWSLHVDAQDRLWIGTNNAGLAMLDRERSQFRHFDRQSHPGLGSNNIWMITSTPDAALWIGTGDAGLVRMDVDGSMRRFVPEQGNPRSLPSLGVTVLRVSEDGTLWVATNANGMARWTGKDFERVPMPLPGLSVDAMTFDRAGNIWIGMPGQGYVMGRDQRIREMPLGGARPGTAALGMLLEDAQGAHWLDTRSGMARHFRGVVQDVPLYSAASRGMVRPAWSSALEDREGGLWFASLDYGLWHVPANWRNFTVLTRRDDDASLANAYVHGVASAQDGGLWLVGSGGVLDWLDPGSGQIRHRMRQVCGDLIATGVIETRDRMVWVGCRGHVTRFDPRTGQSRQWSSNDDEDAALPFATSQFVERDDGSVWMADEQTLQLRDRAGRVLDRIAGGDGRGMPERFSLSQMSRAPDGGLWLSGRTGVLMWNDGARMLEPVPGGPDWPVNGFAVAPDGTVWFAGLGVLASYRWNGVALKPLGSVGVDDGLPAVPPAGIGIDANGNLWLPTVRGLVRYEPGAKRVRVYGVQDGLPSQEFGTSSIRPLPGGMLALGTADGLVLFDPERMRENDRLPLLSIESIDVRRDGARIELGKDRVLTLLHDDHDLRVVLRLLSFTDAHAHRYRFRLRGHDDAWVEADGGERLFPQLRPGDYVLEMQARTADSDWTAVRTLEVRVQRPWWATQAALAGFGLVALLLLWLGARAYRDRLRRRSEWQMAEHKRDVAEQASLAKTRFLATLGHEVRTPMTGVLGMGELLLDTPLDARQRGYVDSIRGAGEHLLRLVNDALDLARIEADKLELDPQPFDLHALVREVRDLCAPVARQRGLAFDSSVTTDAPQWLLGDVVRVRQILLNLLGNANKFTETGGVGLHVEALAPQGVRIVVSDTGPGLNEEQVQRLFRRFEQAEGARTSARYGGSGLGLAICQELTAAMGGLITVDSVPGEGTRFIVDLPLPVAEPVPDVQSATRAVGTRALDVLLVEDDATVAEVMSGLLSSHGHRVTHVGNGLAALAEIATHGFELALLDLDLPGIDGLTLAGMLRGQGFARPMIAVTARADADAETLALQAGFDGFLRKPLTGAMLAAAVDDAMAPSSGSAGV